MMTFRFAKCAVAVGAIGLAAVLPSNAKAADASTTAIATVALAISIVKNADMQFGTIAESASGTVVLATDGSRAVTGGVSTLASGPGAAADFLVTGQPSATYSISLPASVTLINGANSMLADNFVTLPTPTGTLSAGPGTETLLIGGTLNIVSPQATGLYTGAAFNVTVNYN